MKHGVSVLSRLRMSLHRFMRSVEFDRAVLYAVIARVWGMVSGPVTMLFITSYFSPELQGYYYTFYSVLGFQIFAEMGLGTVIIQFAAHEWSKLSLDEHGRIVGDSESLSQLVSLGRIAFKWFAVGGLLVALGLMTGGYIFFSQSIYPGIHWLWPWVILCTVTGMDVFLLPIWSLLEGCNQVSSVYGFRMSRDILKRLVVWFVIALGAGLWTPAISVIAALVWGVMFLTHRYLPFLRTFFSPIKGPRISWRFELWPMQWRIALSWLSGYFTYALFTPVLFHYHGAVVAGQMGMTWGLVRVIGAISISWIRTKVPRFGILIANREYTALDRFFFRIFFVSIVVLLFGGFALWMGLSLLNVMDYPIAKRLLPPLPAALLLLAHALILITTPLAYYLRAHKKEPYVGVSVITAVLTVLSTLLLGSRFGAVGIAIGYLVITSCILPYAVIIFFRCRSAWHSDALGHAVQK